MFYDKECARILVYKSASDVNLNFSQSRQTRVRTRRTDLIDKKFAGDFIASGKIIDEATMCHNTERSKAVLLRHRNYSRSVFVKQEVRPNRNANNDLGRYHIATCRDNVFVIHLQWSCIAISQHRLLCSNLLISSASQVSLQALLTAVCVDHQLPSRSHQRLSHHSFH